MKGGQAGFNVRFVVLPTAKEVIGIIVILIVVGEKMGGIFFPCRENISWQEENVGNADLVGIKWAGLKK